MIRWVGLTLGYLAATVVMTWPLMNYSHLATASYPGDARLITQIGPDYLFKVVPAQ